MDAYEILRKRMITEQIEARGVRNPEVLNAMIKIPRHLFVLPEMKDYAYTDNSLPISNRQTISQPFIVAIMTEWLNVKKDHRILEVGTGTGYQTAILAELAQEVITMERISDLHLSAKERLTEMGYENIVYVLGNGYEGYPEKAPYDGILVTAAAPYVPRVLVSQLANGGRMIIPVGTLVQQLLLVEKDLKGHVTQTAFLDVRFVPMVES